MNLYLRMLLVAAASLRAGRLAALETSRVHVRVMPGDLDVNGHVNNGRTLTLMDLGRLDLSIRTGIVRGMVDLGWRPVVASLAVRFRRELKLGERVEIQTRMVGYDTRWFFLEHRILRGEEVATLAVLRAAFRGPSGLVAPADVAAAMGYHEPSPQLPDPLLAWQEAERTLLAATAGGR
jgi:acyl-CoA thioesterase FadM